MTKIVIALTVLLLLLLAGNFGLVWAVVVYNTPTTVNSNVLTAKATGDPVQVSSADFYYDTNGLLQLRNRGAQVSMDWVSSSADSCASDTCSADAGVSTGRRRLLQTLTGSTANVSTSTTVASTTQFTPTCNFSSPDFYTNSSYFFTGTCTFTKLVSMRTVMLPMLPSKTTAQVGGGIIDANAWKDGAQTVYAGCFNRTGSAMQVTLSASTTLANCETLAVSGSDSQLKPLTYFGYTGISTSATGSCFACSISNSACMPSQTMTCTATSGVQVFQVLRSPNRYMNSGPGPMGNLANSIPGGVPSAPVWSFTTLVITRVDYVKNVFRDYSNNALTVCQANLLRFYVQPMTTSGSVTSISGSNNSYIDICLTPMSKSGNPTWVGNYTVHSTGKSSVFTNTGTSSGQAYYDRPSVTGFSTPVNTDFQSVLSYYCSNCPSGPYIDYSNLQYDSNLFELPCTKKGITWKYRDYYSSQGCPAWDPANPTGQSNCTWTTAESSAYGGLNGLSYCILTMDAFTTDESIYTFDNQLSFLANTGRTSTLIQKTQTAVGDSGVPPLYNYNLAGGSGLWKDYYYTSDDGAAAVSGAPFFTSNRPSALTIVTSRRHLLQTLISGNTYTLSANNVNTTYQYVGDCANTAGFNGYSTSSITSVACTGSSTISCATGVKPMSNMNYGKAYGKFCRCSSNNTTSYCESSFPKCSSGSCYASSGTSTGSASLMTN